MAIRYNSAVIHEAVENRRVMPMHKISGFHLYILRFSVIFVAALLAPLSSSAENLYLFTQASVANLRAEPARDAEIVARLPIGTFITSTEQREPWVQVSVPMAKPVTGWLHRDMLGKNAPWLGGLMAEFERTDPQDLAERLKWLERAAAVAPSHTPALVEFAKTLEALGENDKARSVRQSIADMAERGVLQSTNFCHPGIDGCRAYYAPDSFYDLGNSWGTIDSGLSCRRELIEIFVKGREAMAEASGLTPHTIRFDVSGEYGLNCTQFESNLHRLMLIGNNQIMWRQGGYSGSALSAMVKRTEGGCGDYDYVVEVDPFAGRERGHLLLARSQSVPTTRARLPYFEVPFKQTDASGDRIGAVDANALVTKVWIKQTTVDGWIGEPGATPETVTSGEALYITVPGNDEPQKVFVEPGFGKYSYSHASINSVHVADINGDDFADIIVDATNSGHNLLVSKGLAQNGRIIWERQLLRPPNYTGIGGC